MPNVKGTRPENVFPSRKSVFMIPCFHCFSLSSCFFPRLSTRRRPFRTKWQLREAAAWSSPAISSTFDTVTCAITFTYAQVGDQVALASGSYFFSLSLQFSAANSVAFVFFCASATVLVFTDKYRCHLMIKKCLAD